MPVLQFYFLGTLDIRYGDQPLPKPPTLKSQSLLAYLVCHRHQPQPRARLAGLFWGDRPEHKARHSLATSLWHIRRCLPHEEAILGDSHTVQFDPQVRPLARRGRIRVTDRLQRYPRLASGVTLYRGDFLDGFYDDWILNERYRLEYLYADALARLMVAQEASGEQGASAVHGPAAAAA